MRKNHNKLYYGRFRHKTEFKMPGSLMFYPTTDEHLIKIKRENPKAPHINKLADFITTNRKNIKFRFQDRRVIFYSNKDLSLQLINNFWDWWIGYSTVDPRFTGLSKDVVGCSRLPHGKYSYQVHLKKDAHQFITKKQRDSLREYIERNIDHCLVPGYAILDYLEDRCPYVFGGYFYVTEEKFLTPIYMMVQNGIDKVVKFRKVKNGSNKKVKR